MAEQLELPFEEPPAAPGRAAAAPPRRPKTDGSGRSSQSWPPAEKKVVHSGAVGAPAEQSGIPTPPEPAGPPLGPELATVPTRCPVVGKPVCYYADCRHFQGGGCVHPEAVRRSRRRRR